MKKSPNAPIIPFTSYQKFVIFILAITQFTVILDFMIMSPLGDLLMKSMSLKPKAFGFAVSAYAFSAGISGLLTAGFADRFDRKKLLLFFYAGFIGGTVFCGLAQTYTALVAARIITGLFGGVIGSISMAIITDLFALEQRGRVMGFVQMGFGASQVLGVPIGFYLATTFGWETPFFMIVGMAVLVFAAIFMRLEPVAKHLEVQRDKSPLTHLWHTIQKRDYRIAFTATALLSIGGFMMMPFGTAFAVNNLHIREDLMTWLFMISGVTSLIVMPIIGRLSDKVSKLRLFAGASVWTMIICVIYTNLGTTPFGIVIILNILMMMGILSRMIPATALTSAIPEMSDRGAFMSINASLQQIAGGVAAGIAGMIVMQKDKTSPLEHYDVIGYVIVGISILAIFLMSRVSALAKKRAAHQHPVLEKDVIVSEEDPVTIGSEF